MSMELLQLEDRSVVRLAEPITLSCAGELHKLLVEAVGAKRSLALDLEGVSELDTSGVQLLYAAWQAAERAGIPFSCEGRIPAVVRNAFLETGLDAFPLASRPEVN